MILRVPGIGPKTAQRLLNIRRWQTIRLKDLIALKAMLNKALPFIICGDHHPGNKEPGSEQLRQRLRAPADQLTLAL
jgi:predicted DNA-binding helix-hairpin-helix protein